MIARTPTVLRKLASIRCTLRPTALKTRGNLQRSDPRRRRLRDKDMMSNIFAPIANLSKSEAPTTITVAGTFRHTILYEWYLHLW